MRFILNHHWNLFIIYVSTCCFLLPSLGNAQQDTIDSVWFPANNFTYCNQQEQFDVLSVNRYFDVKTSTYYFNFTSTSNMTVTNLNQQGSTSSASMMQLRFGFQTINIPAQQFCPDSVNGCPIPANQNFTIQRSYNLSNIPLYPLADITAQYSAIAADSTHLVCITLAPVGYQHPIWRTIFTWLPIGITITAAIISLIASFTIFHDDDAAEHDIFLFSSNYAMLPGVLRLKTPGFFDLIFYSQFIVTTGLFNIDYPRFHALFTSNFAWSFLLNNDSRWLQQVTSSLFKSSSAFIENIGSIPGYSIYKRQLADNSTVMDNSATSFIDISGTGMSDFATAIGIDINALFFTMMVFLLLIIGSCLVLCSLVWSIFYLIGTFSNNGQKSIVKSKKMWDFTIGVLVRILTLAYLPLLTLSFYQLMIPSFWYITFLAACFLVTPFLFYGFVAIKLLQIRPTSFIFTELKLLLRYGTLYNTFTDDTFHFFLAIIVYKSLVAAMIGLFQTSGLAQIILVIIAECSLMVGLIYKLPYADSQVNLVHTVFGFIRIIVLALNIAYLPNLQVTAMSKQYVGYVQMAIHCLAFFLFLVLQIKNLVTIITGLGDDELDETGKPPARMVMWRKRNRPVSEPHQMRISSTATLMTAGSSNNGNNRRSRSYSASFYMGNNGSGSNRNSTNNRLTMDSQTLDMFTNYYSVANNSSSASQSIAVLKPDEVRHHGATEASSPPNHVTNENMLLQYPALVSNYLNNSTTASSTTSSNPAIVPIKSKVAPIVTITPTARPLVSPIQMQQESSSVARTVYRLDDDIIPSSEPLMSAINDSLLNQRQSSTTKKASQPPPLPKHLIFNNTNNNNNNSISPTSNNSSSIHSPPHQASSIITTRSNNVVHP